MRTAALVGIVSVGAFVLFSVPPAAGQPPPQSQGIGISVEVPCTVNCPVTEIPTRGPGPPETRAAVTVEGFGPPNALLYILLDGAVARTSGIPASGSFSVSLTGLSPGPVRIGVFAVDVENLVTPTVSVGVVLSEGNITRIFNLLLPPTIRVDHDLVRAGERVIVSGQTFPKASVRLRRDPDRQAQEVVADRQGRWSALVATEKLIGPYEVTARSSLPSGLISEESATVSFTVIPFPGREPVPPRPPGVPPPPRPEGPAPRCADSNGDRLVNLSDFSIILYNWGVPKDPATDCNGDGVVNLIDLSILLFWWTG